MTRVDEMLDRNLQIQQLYTSNDSNYVCMQPIDH